MMVWWVLDKYNPNQFEIIGMASSAGYNEDIVDLPFLGKKDARPLIAGKNTYARVFIRRKGTTEWRLNYNISK